MQRWSIVDLWVAKHLLLQGRSAVQAQAILRLASPHFPRRHADPDDYLHTEYEWYSVRESKSGRRKR